MRPAYSPLYSSLIPLASRFFEDVVADPCDEDAAELFLGMVKVYRRKFIQWSVQYFFLVVVAPILETIWLHMKALSYINPDVFNIQVYDVSMDFFVCIKFFDKGTKHLLRLS